MFEKKKYEIYEICDMMGVSAGNINKILWKKVKYFVIEIATCIIMTRIWDA